MPSGRIWPERENLDSLIYVGASSCTVRSHISTVMFCMLQLIASRARTTNKALKILRCVTDLSHLPFVRAWLLGCCYITAAASTASLASCLWCNDISLQQGLNDTRHVITYCPVPILLRQHWLHCMLAVTPSMCSQKQSSGPLQSEKPATASSNKITK